MQPVYTPNHMALFRGNRSSSQRHGLHRRRSVGRTFQLLRDQIDHHLPPYTAIVWEEEYSPNSKKEKTRTKRGTSIALVPKAWQAYRSLQPPDTCEREHA